MQHTITTVLHISGKRAYAMKLWFDDRWHSCARPIHIWQKEKSPTDKGAATMLRRIRAAHARSSSVCNDRLCTSSSSTPKVSKPSKPDIAAIRLNINIGVPALISYPIRKLLHHVFDDFLLHASPSMLRTWSTFQTLLQAAIGDLPLLIVVQESSLN